MRRLVLLLVLIGGLGPGTRAAGAVSCPYVDCLSGVAVDQRAYLRTIHHRAVVARVCVGRSCTRLDLRRRQNRLTTVGSRELTAGPVRVAVSLRDRRGRRLLHQVARVPLRRSQPGGPDCSPVCFFAEIRLHPRSGEIVTVAPRPRR